MSANIGSEEFAGLAVVVTGGTGALGTKVVDALLCAGAICHVPNNAPAELQGWALSGRARLHVVEGIDLTVESEVVRFYAGAGPLWASIHIAGGFEMSKLEETSAAAFSALWRLNTLTSFLCCREAVSAIRRRPAGSDPAGGRLVNISARPGLEPRSGAGMAAYTVSKAGVAALSASLAAELSPERIWVNSVAPSILDTAANRNAMPKARHELWPSPQEVAHAIVQLASPHNTCVTGAAVTAYGSA